MHVLLCEDDDLIASGIAAGLSAQGMTVDRVATAAAAQAMLQAAAFDVMVLDLGLPCLLYTSPSPRDLSTSRMPSSA